MKMHNEMMSYLKNVSKITAKTIFFNDGSKTEAKIQEKYSKIIINLLNL